MFFSKDGDLAVRKNGKMRYFGVSSRKEPDLSRKDVLQTIAKAMVATNVDVT
jgi:hypothetical protein